MHIAVLTIKLHAPWAHSLKEKRMVVKSLLAKLHSKFNVSAAEIDAQELHQTIVLGIAAIAASTAQADSILEHVECFVESHTDAEVVDIQREHR